MKTDTTVLVVLASGVAVLGRWSQGKSLDGWKMGGALLMVVIFLILFDYFVPEVAKPLAGLFLVATLINYGAPFLHKLVASPESRAPNAPR